MSFFKVQVLICTVGLILCSSQARQLYADSAESSQVPRNYSTECGKPNGPCNPGYTSQLGVSIAADGLCPDDSPCEEGYYCGVVVGLMPDFGLPNLCYPIQYPCGNYLGACCAPEFTCDGKGPRGEPLTCQVPGGPYFPIGSGHCLSNPKCGGAMEPCCQPWGHRDFWKNRETSDGIFSNPSLCDSGHYCNYHTPLRETPLNGTCIPNDPECGLLGKPCCVSTMVTAEWRDNSRQILSCNVSNAFCDQASQTCLEIQVFDTVEEVYSLCGKPNGACAPPYVPPSSSRANFTSNSLDTECDKGCPSGYLCALVEYEKYDREQKEIVDLAVPMCLGPADPNCGTLGKPCCPWKIDDETVDGDLHCDAFAPDGTPLQCRSMFALNQDLSDKSFTFAVSLSNVSFFSWDGEKSRQSYLSAIQSSMCTPIVECGSENNPCCHDYQTGYLYTNPASINKAGNESLLCADGLYCHYDNFTILHPQGTCIPNDPECGQQKGSPCCKRSLLSPLTGVRGMPETDLGKQEFYCRNKSIQCEYTTMDTVMQFGKAPSCVTLI